MFPKLEFASKKGIFVCAGQMVRYTSGPVTRQAYIRHDHEIANILIVLCDVYPIMYEVQ